MCTLCCYINWNVSHAKGACVLCRLLWTVKFADLGKGEKTKTTTILLSKFVEQHSFVVLIVRFTKALMT